MSESQARLNKDELICNRAQWCGAEEALCAAVEDLQDTGSEAEKAQTRTLCSFRRGSVCAAVAAQRAGTADWGGPSHVAFYWSALVETSQ